MENTFSHLQNLIQSAGTRLYDRLVDIFPQLTVALVVLLIGLLIASLSYYLCLKIFSFFAIDKLVAKTPLATALRTIGLTRSVSQIVGLLVFWMIVLITMSFASDVLQLDPVSHTLTTVTGFIPQIIIALLMVVFGLLLARFLEILVSQWVERLNIGYDRFVGKLVYVTVLVCVCIVAFQQLGLDLSFLTTNVLQGLFVLLIILCIGGFIAGRVFLENVIAAFQLHTLLTTGQEVTIGDTKGVIEAFTLTSVIVSPADGENQIVLPASLFLREKYTICWQSDDPKSSTKRRLGKR